MRVILHLDLHVLTVTSRAHIGGLVENVNGSIRVAGDKLKSIPYG